MKTPLGKRIVDVLAASVALVLFAPVIVVIAAAIRWSMGKPVLFRQSRAGLGGRQFTLYKFRTMADRRNAGGHLLPDDQRLTRVGSMIRRSSLDELPQLWNVLLGDMSLIGPRPLLLQYLDRYTPEQFRRHEARPGITGWAQVNGRNELAWERKFELDVWYVDHWSYWLDMKIIWLTLVKLVRREGVSAAGHATMPEFMGSQSTKVASHD